MSTIPSREPATLGTRVFSSLIDYIPMFIISIVITVSLFLMFITIFREIESQTVYSVETSDYQNYVISHILNVTNKIMIITSIYMTLTYTYFFSKDLFGGRSWGKRNRGLQIVRKKTNEPVSTVRLVCRNLTIVLGWIEVIVMLVNPTQRLGDMICDTMVVKADDSNIQVYDKKKVYKSILIVFLCVAAISILYYLVFSLFIKGYFNILETAIQQ